MADERITDLTEDTSPASGDWLVMVDVDDTTMNPTGTDKKVKPSNAITKAHGLSDGLIKVSSGVMTDAVSGTDYAPATTGSSILKGNGSGGFSSAVADTDYAPATSGSNILKGNGSGGFSAAASGTDYAPATSGSSILKGNGSGGFSSAASGTDYAPATSGSSALKGNGSGGFSNATLNDVGAASADYSINSHKLTNVNNPTNPQDAATKNYVDAASQGLNVKPSVRVATTGSESFTISSGSVTQISGTTIDGVSPSVNDRILIKDAPSATGTGSANSTQPGNGIYVVTSNTTNLSLSRATDMSGSNGPAGAYTFVEAGTANASAGYVVSTPGSGAAFTYGTNNIAWTQFSGAGEITAGTGLSKSGNTISLNTPVSSSNGGAGTVSGILKANGSGAVSAAVSGTDYAPATSGSSALKGNGSGGFANAVLNDVGAPTANYDMNAFNITGLADPTTADEAANKRYVDSKVGTGITWSTISGSSQTAAPDNGYITSSGSLTTVTLSTSPAVGDVIYVVGGGAGTGGWKVTTSGTIQFDDTSTSTLTSTNDYDVVELLCTYVGLGVTWTVIATLGDVSAGGSLLNPIGLMQPYAGRVAPNNWLLCYGQAVSRTTYASLFNVLVPLVGNPTVTIASPGVFTLNSHGFINGDAIYLTTTGSLPTGLSANTIYYVVSATTNTFELSSSYGGSAINTSGSQSGTHSIYACPYGLGDGSTTFNVPDVRGRVVAGADAMGGTAASRLTNPATTTNGVNGNQGAAGGEQAHVQSATELATHAHSKASQFGNPGNSFSDPTVWSTVNTSVGGSPGNTGSAGSSVAANIVQPTLVANYIIRAL
jgi:microcystin-dependent protein